MTTRAKPAKRAISLVAAVAASLMLVGCSPSSTPSTNPTDAKISIVTSTSVWGSVAKAIGGDLVEVTSIIDSTSVEPHSYSASARDRLAVNHADIVVMNGGGYDDFMQQLVDQDETPAITVDAYQAAGDDATRNEHIWYDYVQTQDVAAVIAGAIEAVDPSTFDEGQANFEAFKQKLEGLTAMSAGIMNTLDNVDVVQTEPVAAYLLASMGFNDVTPAAFTKAIEEEREVPPLALKVVKDKITYALISFLVVNPATVTNQTETLRNFALANGVAVVEFGELPPANTTYIDWMTANVVQVRKLAGIGQ